MLSKFHKNLISSVSILSNKKYPCIISSNNFSRTKKELQILGMDYQSYPFIKSFLVETNFDTLVKISKNNSINFLAGTTKVSTTITNAKKFIGIDVITKKQYCGQGITIAIIDTGIFPHLDFIFPKNRIIEFVDLINGKKYPYDDNGHGTFVASTCSGSGKRSKQKYSGVASASNLVVIKALDKNGETNSNKILDAMQYIYDNQKRLNIKIACMSFGADNLDDKDPLQKGATELWNKGIIVVAAAGNSGPKEKTIKSPGATSKIITVGGLDNSDNENLKVAEFSSRGPVKDRFKPDLIAPSVNIIGANIDIKNPYIKMSGTSVATPIVAGICAIFLEQNITLSPDRLKYILIRNCFRLSSNKNSEGFGYISFKNIKPKIN